MLLHLLHEAAACLRDIYQTAVTLALTGKSGDLGPDNLVVQATGALDADTEAALYAGLAGRVGAYVSVGALPAASLCNALSWLTHVDQLINWLIAHC